MSAKPKSKPKTRTAKTQTAATEKARRQALAEVTARLNEPSVAADETAPVPAVGRDVATGDGASAPPEVAPAPKSGRPRGGKGEKTKKKTEDKGQPRQKRPSALDAAATVLAGAAKPMRAVEMIAEMETRGLWKSPGGRTPEATLYAAIIREIAAKGTAARFRKVERGLFAAGKGA